MDDLLTYLFDGQHHPLAPSLATWLTGSRRFAAFVDTFRDKIRKKLRTTHDPEMLQDLRLELETAYLLLREPALSVVYEPKQSELVRSPDFAVSFTTRMTFMVEVTRFRAEPKNLLAAAQTQVNERLADMICRKLSQLLPQRSNVLIVGVDNQAITQNALQATLLGLQQRVESNDTALLHRHRFRDRADFFRHYQRLSEVLMRGSESLEVWVNRQAKHPIPSPVRTVLYRSHMG